MINTIEVKTIEEYNKTVSQKEIILVTVYATWCKPCRRALSNLEVASNAKNMENVVFYKIDFDKHKEIIKEIGNKGFPMMILYKNGVEVRRIVGLIEEDEIMNWTTAWSRL
jgi:thioredoxin 1